MQRGRLACGVRQGRVGGTRWLCGRRRPGGGRRACRRGGGGEVAWWSVIT